MTTDTVFVRAAGVQEIEPGQGLRCVVRDRTIALFNVDGSIHAIDDLCTHATASLAEDWLEGCEIECPLHQGRFDVTTGKATAAPCVVDVASYPVRIEDGQVLVGIPD